MDLGLGNLQSVVWAFERSGAAARLSCGEGLDEAAGVVLPGVGHFSAAAERIAQLDLARRLRGLVRQVPLLGICLGMQLLFERSEEGGEGLALLQGDVVRLAAPGLPLPHTGWNDVETVPGGFLHGIGDGEAYFVHQYAARPRQLGTVAAWTPYGERFASAVAEGRICGVQFHPERSGAYGRKVLLRFLEEVAQCSRSSRQSISREGTSCA